MKHPKCLNKLFEFKYHLQYIYHLEKNNFLYIILNKKQKVIPKVVSIEDTIRKIVDEKCSVSRFGDGECLLIANKSIGYQNNSDAMSSRLREVLLSQSERHLVCIPEIFSTLKPYNRYTSRFWRYHLYTYGKMWDECLYPDRTYYNAFISRPYIEYKSKMKSGYWFNLLKEIWDNRDIIFVEGEKSRLGVGNDLFDNASSIRRILCPAENAFDKYEEILSRVKLLGKDDLILIALGPTATILAYDLYHLGFQAIDLGHVDVEYEWFRIRATKRVKLPNKYVNEATNGNIVEDVNDEIYKRQNIGHIQ